MTGKPAKQWKRLNILSDLAENESVWHSIEEPQTGKSDKS